MKKLNSHGLGEANIAAFRNHVVAQLTESVVHDFRNLCFVFDTNLELLNRRTDLPEDVRPLLNTVSQAAQQGRELAVWLQSLSRSTEPPEVVSLQALAIQVNAFARKALPSSFTFSCDAVDSGAKALVRKSDLGQALIGVVFFVRDEMPAGCVLSLQMRNGNKDNAKPTAIISIAARPALAPATSAHAGIEAISSLAISMGGTLNRLDDNDVTTFQFELPAPLASGTFL